MQHIYGVVCSGSCEPWQAVFEEEHGCDEQADECHCCAGCDERHLAACAEGRGGRVAGGRERLFVAAEAVPARLTHALGPGSGGGACTVHAFDADSCKSGMRTDGGMTSSE